MGGFYLKSDCAFYIKQAFNLYDSGLYSLRSLTAKLYKDGFRSSSGRRVPQSTVEFILKNIFYTGVFKFKDIVFRILLKLIFAILNRCVWLGVLVLPASPSMRVWVLKSPKCPVISTKMSGIFS